jgi:hypothetical protein
MVLILTLVGLGRVNSLNNSHFSINLFLMHCELKNSNNTQDACASEFIIDLDLESKTRSTTTLYSVAY